MNKIGVVGLGYVGTAVQKGFESIRRVATYDIIKECNTNSIEDLVMQSQIIFICVPTPMNTNGTCNVDIVKSVLKEISEVETWHKPICVLKSTVTPGTTKELVREFSNLTICFNPEFLTERNYINDFMSQVNIIIGYSTAPKEIQPVLDLYYERFPNSQVWTTPAT
jgi:UDPglucose 6-dehydrogenase